MNRSEQLFVECMNAALLLIVLCALMALGGCTSVDVLSQVDYACVDIQVDGPYTDSGMQGRGIVLPDGETLTPETVDRLCG